MKVSIIIPAFNAEIFLRETIESALTQSRPPTQVVVVDDGSADDTAEVAKDFGPAVHVIQTDNQGVAAARNVGAEQATGGWLLFLNADDRLRRDALKTLTTRAGEGEFGVVYGKTICFDQLTGQRTELGTVKCQGPIPAGALANFSKSNVGTAGSAMIRRELFEKVGGFAPRFNTMASRDLWMKAGMLSEFGFCDAPVIEKRMHGSNMSRNFPRRLRETGEVQLDFLGWAHKQNFKTDFLNTGAPEILDQLLRRALNAVSIEGLKELLDLAEIRRIRSRLVPRSERYVAMNASLARFILGWRVRFLRRFIKDLEQDRTL